MELYQSLLKRNRAWVKKRTERDPDFFKRLAGAQHPEVLWIGCSDSRVPANEITGTQPGDIFVHRNIANMVVHSDMNMLSVLDYAVNILKVKHVIVCGHYGCGGVEAALKNTTSGLIDQWLRFIKDVYHAHAAELASIEDPQQRINRCVELNVLQQADHVVKTTIIQSAWQRGSQPLVHAWVYDIRTGLITDLNLSSSTLAPSQVLAGELAQAPY